MGKTKYLGLRIEPSLYNFLNFVVKKIAPKDARNPTTISELVTAILRRFWLEYFVDVAKPSMSELEKQFRNKYEKEAKRRRNLKRR